MDFRSNEADRIAPKLPIRRCHSNCFPSDLPPFFVVPCLRMASGASLWITPNLPTSLPRQRRSPRKFLPNKADAPAS